MSSSAHAQDDVAAIPLLLDGVPMTGLSSQAAAANNGIAHSFTMTRLRPGSRLFCALQNSSGNATLDIVIKDVFLGLGPTCVTKTDSNTQVCTVGPIYTHFTGTATITVKALADYSNVTLTCSEEASEWITLQDGEVSSPTTTQSTSYFLPNIPPMTIVQCDVVASEGKPDVFAQMGSRDGSVFDYCDLRSHPFQLGDVKYDVQSIVTSSVVCEMHTQREIMGLYLQVSPDPDATTNSELTVTCRLKPLPVKKLRNWKAISDTNTLSDSGPVTPSIYYYNIDNLVKAGRSVSCFLSSKTMEPESSGVIDVYFGNLTNTTTTPVYGCKPRSSESFCITSRDHHEDNTPTFVQVSIYSPKVSAGELNWHVVCGYEPKMKQIKNGEAIHKLTGAPGGENALRTFRIDVLKGESLSCNTRLGTGNADLFIGSGKKRLRLPFSDTSINGCQSSTTKSSTENCTTPVFLRDTRVFVSLHAVEKYHGLRLQCNRNNYLCKTKDNECKTTLDCCGDKFTCDGRAGATKVCKRAIAASGKCTRNSECLSGHVCEDGRCVKKEADVF